MDKIIFNLFIHIIYTSFYEKKKNCNEIYNEIIMNLFEKKYLIFLNKIIFHIVSKTFRKE